MTNNRKHARLDFAVPVEIVVDGRSQPGQSVNISRGGIFISTDPLPEFGTRLRLDIRLPGLPEPCSIPCVVRWANTGEGVGLQFELLRAIEVWALGRLLRGIESAGS